jgi:hypothetical protein
MMFALEITTTGEPMEGIIFPKHALKFSQSLQEKEVYFVFGKEGKKQKKKEVALEDEGQMQEYDELPKLLLDSISPFHKGIHELLDHLEKKPTIAGNKLDIIKSVDWQQLLLSPTAFDTNNLPQAKGSVKKLSQLDSPTQPNDILQFKFPLGTNPDILKQFKQSLHKEHTPHSLPVSISIETKDGWKNAKGEFYLSTNIKQQFEAFLVV